MAVNRAPRDLGDIVNRIDQRLNKLERRGRGFSIPPASPGLPSIGANEPPADPGVIGTLWIDTDDGNKIYRWSGSAWEPTLDPTVDIDRNIISTAIVSWQDVDATNDGVVHLYRQSTAPGATGLAVGDLWVRASDGLLHRWNGTGWASQGDTELAALLDKPAFTSSIADGRVRTWWQNHEPTPEGFGDLWVKTSDDPNTLWRWNNFNWVQILDWSVYLQQGQLEGKISTYYMETPPVASAPGDIWYDLGNDNHPYRAEYVGADGIGSGWVSVQDLTIQEAAADAATANSLAQSALTAAELAQGTADGAIHTHYQDTAPWSNGSTDHEDDTGDMWYDTANGKVYRWNHVTSSWQPITDSAIQEALEAAQDAQTTADGKITAYYSPTAPTAAVALTGDLWYDTDDKNKVYYWDGDSWEPISDGRIAEHEAAITQLGTDLAANQAAIAAAQTDLDAAETQINDAFGQIDLKPDQAYVDAAKQQAIDAAAIDAQAKADQAEAEALAKVESLSAGLDNKVRNPGFENGMTGWDNAGGWVADETQAHSGGTSARLDGPSSVGLSSPVEIPVRPGQTWRWTSWVKTSTDFSGNLGMRPIRRGSNVANVPGHVNVPAAVVEGWQKLVMDYTVIEGDTHLQAMRFANQIDTGTVWIDDVSFTDVTEVVALEADLQAAIASGDAAAIADAEAKIAVAKAEAIDAAADDAASKAAAAQSAAVQASQDALDQAQTDLQQAISSGDAAAIADAEAKIATARQEAIDAAALDATAKAAEAMQKANAALSAAQSAQATADNAIRTYYSETPPWADGTTQPDDVLGDMWYQDSTGQAYRWNGTTWKVIQDGAIADALAAAANAQTTADGKITAFYQDNEPLEADEGDLWFDTNNDSAIHRRTGGAWVALLDPKALADAAEQAAKTAAAADATAKAEAAEAAAAATAAADATQKANQAKADAEAAAKAYTDALDTGASDADLAAARTYAEQQAEAARIAAETAAAADATAKAEAAEAAAAATAALDATAKADAAQAAAIAEAEAVENRALSRGTDLVTNGTGYLKNNYNFSSLTYVATDAPPGMTGSFKGNPGSYTQPRTDELIPVDPSKKYRLSTWAKTVEKGSGSSGGKLYMWYSPYDSAGREMLPRFFRYRAGSTTTLAQPLNPGDTKIHLTDGSGWDNSGAAHLRTIIWWDYVDEFGKAFPPETYSRNISSNDYYAVGGISGNTITLNAPYNEVARPAGTPLSNGFTASSYLYLGWMAQVPSDTTWEQRSEVIAGVTSAPGNAIGGANGYTFPYGTASIKIGYLMNYQPVSGWNIAISGISLSDAAMAQATADAAAASLVAVQGSLTGLQGQVDGKANIYVQTTAPTGLTASDKGDIWIDTSDGKRVTKVWSGSVWYEADTRTAEALASVSTKVTTYYQATAPTGTGFTTGDLWVNSTGKIARWSGSAWVDLVDPQALADTAESNAKAYALTTANGLAKTFWSTALPGTTSAPVDSVWYRHSGGKIVSVFNQTASPSGSTWAARPITSEAIDNLDVGKLTAASGTINQLVVNEFAAKLANIIQANIGNLTVTGDTHLNSVVAEQVAGDVATFIKITADNIVGRLIEGVEITGSTVTGSTVQTSADGVYPRIAMSPFYGITAQPAAGVHSFQVSPHGHLTARDAEIIGNLTTSASGAGVTLGKNPDWGDGGAVLLHSSRPEESEPATMYGGSDGWAGDFGYGLHLKSPKTSTYDASRISLTGQDATSGGGIYLATGGPSGLIYLKTANGGLRVNSASVEVEHSGGQAMYWLTDGGGRGVRSTDIYNRTYGAAANVHVTSAGTLGRSTSATKYKLLPEPLRDVEDEILSLTPKTWFDKGQAETLADLNTALDQGEPTETEDGQPLFDVDVTHRIPGLIAEDVEAAGLGQFVVYGPDGQVEELMYDRLAVALIPTVRRQRDRITALEDRLAALEERLTTPGAGD